MIIQAVADSLNVSIRTENEIYVLLPLIDPVVLQQEPTVIYVGYIHPEDKIQFYLPCLSKM